MKKNFRKTKLSVTNFLHCDDHYLFIHRDSKRSVDANRLNGIGGKLEHVEDYMSAAIRETQEETGYVVSAKDMEIAGIVRLEDGYKDDWVMVFFKIEVPHMNTPIGSTNEEGDLIWIHKDKVLDSDYELVDDLNYIFEDISGGKIPFFMAAKINGDEKIEKHRLEYL